MIPNVILLSATVGWLVFFAIKKADTTDKICILMWHVGLIIHFLVDLKVLDAR